MFEFLGDFSELRLQLSRQFSLELSTMSFVDFGFRPQGELRQLRDKLDSGLVWKVAQTRVPRVKRLDVGRQIQIGFSCCFDFTWC